VAIGKVNQAEIGEGGNERRRHALQHARDVASRQGGVRSI
jgi:hypothetical protein